MSEPAVLASAPRMHCCASGFLHEGTPSGETTQLAGLNTYIARPKEPTNKIVLFFSDVYGPFFINNSLLIDWFASQGYLVVAVDYFEGDPIHLAREREGFNLDEWIGIKHPRATLITPTWIDAVMSTFGYCFGASFVMDICAADKVKAGAFAHPALLNENHFENIKLSNASPRAPSEKIIETDFTFPSEARHRSEVILAEIKATYHYQLFSGVQHGFALRGDMNVENERIVGLVVGFPLDTVKVRLQDPSISERYSHSSTFSSVVKIFREERIQGLYKGITSPLVKLIIPSLPLYSKGNALNEGEPSLVQVTLAGAGSGVAAAFITCPTELVKIRQQALIESRPSARQVALDVVRENGFFGLYRGMTITILRDLGYGAYFLAYIGTCRFLRPSIDSDAYFKKGGIPEASWTDMLIAGGAAGIVAKLLVSLQ
ncbi:hypothetical protein Clacol_005779 [Clathrus columnatus]|uniref:Dienelactone hydrolase domain-containing protein n=1 Tax=Clathrus columnatus TaxID=1419009 RepID=A0AAV5AHX2_9AGAM|nr:hypothetical protein Clacol_005779 [Clathrus columnatus]